MKRTGRWSSVASALSTPLSQEWVFFLLTLAMWAPHTIMVVAHCLLALDWHSPFYDRIIYFSFYAVAWTYLCTAAVAWSRWRWLKVALYAISMLNWGLYLFLKFNFHTTLTPDVLQAVIETNPDETAEFWRQYALSKGSIQTWSGVAVMACAIVMGERWWSHREHRQTSALLGGVVAMTLVGCCFCLRPFVSMLRCKTIDQLEVCEIYGSTLWGGDNLTTDIYAMHAVCLSIGDSRHAIEMSLTEVASGTSHSSKPDSLTMVVVIGETYIKSHCGLYGYYLDTTPNLSREHRAGSLWVFDDVISPYNYTSSSLKNALFCNSVGDGERWSDYPSLMAVMRRAGYDVMMWDNQLQYHSDAVFSFALNGLLYNNRLAQACYTAMSDSCFDYDEQLIEDYLSSPWHAKPTTGKLVVFHLMGQHWMFSERYPREDRWEYFTADSVKADRPWLTAEKRHEIAVYDNATRYNDHVLGRIMDAYREDNAVIVYFADHGEEIYDWRDFAGRDESLDKQPLAIVYQNSVPMIVWCSERYRQSHPDIVRRLDQGRHNPFMHDNICQVIFDLAQIETPHYHPERDPLSARFSGVRRIVYDRIDYDKMPK